MRSKNKSMKQTVRKGKEICGKVQSPDGPHVAEVRVKRKDPLALEGARDIMSSPNDEEDTLIKVGPIVTDKEMGTVWTDQRGAAFG